MLDYENKQAPREKMILRDVKQSGRALPKAIADAPDLEEENQFYYVAFGHLTSCRNYDNGPIPHNRIVEYGFLYDLEPEMLEILVDVIMNVDDWFREEIAKAIQAEIDKQKNGR